MSGWFELVPEYSQALRGDFTQLLSKVSPSRKVPMDRAWYQLVSSLITLVSPSSKREISVEDILWIRDEEAEAHRLGDLICRHQELGCVLRFDCPSLHRWRDAHHLIVGDDEAPHARLGLMAADTWMALLDGDAERALAGAIALTSMASDEGDAPLVLESMVQRALGALALKRTDEALQAARSGSRMANTEELILHEYLANIVLARVRRYTGKPHLAERILVALGQVAPRPWIGWIAWELLFAGSFERAEALLQASEPPVDSMTIPSPSAHVLKMLRAAQSGDQQQFTRAISEFEAPGGLWWDMASEARCVATALSMECEDEIEGSQAAWLKGENETLPGALQGMIAPVVARDGMETPAVLVAYDGRKSRRVLFHGIGLLPGNMSTQLLSFSLLHTKMYSALAALALAGAEGMPEAHLFHSVYGFPYDQLTHNGVLRTLLYRMRKGIEGFAEVNRIEGRLVLQPLGLFVIPDPRSAPELEDLILRTLANLGGRASAKETASALSIPIRTVQSTLKRLVGEGACTVERSGRRIEYTLEDTTFFEPTLQRLAPR